MLLRELVGQVAGDLLNAAPLADGQCGLRRLVAGDEVLQESPGQVRVVEVAQVILHGLDLVDHQRGFRPQNLREEFQRVAQALELDAQGVEGLDRGAGEHRLVGADGLVAGVDQGRRQVAGKVGGG